MKLGSCTFFISVLLLTFTPVLLLLILTQGLTKLLRIRISQAYLECIVLTQPFWDILKNQICEGQNDFPSIIVKTHFEV